MFIFNLISFSFIWLRVAASSSLASSPAPIDTLDPGHTIPLDPGHTIPLDPGHTIPLDPGTDIPLLMDIPLVSEFDLPITYIGTFLGDPSHQELLVTIFEKFSS